MHYLCTFLMLLFDYLYIILSVFKRCRQIYLYIVFISLFIYAKIETFSLTHGHNTQKATKTKRKDFNVVFQSSNIIATLSRQYHVDTPIQIFSILCSNKMIWRGFVCSEITVLILVSCIPKSYLSIVRIPIHICGKISWHTLALPRWSEWKRDVQKYGDFQTYRKRDGTQTLYSGTQNLSCNR